MNATLEEANTRGKTENFTLIAVHNDKFLTPELNRAITDLIRQGRAMIGKVFVLNRPSKEPQLSEDQVRIYRSEEVKDNDKYILTGWYLGTCVFNTFRNLLRRMPTHKICAIHISLDTVEDEVLQIADIDSLKKNIRFKEIVDKYYGEALKRGDVTVFLDGEIYKTSGGTDFCTTIHFYSSSQSFLKTSAPLNGTGVLK